MPRAGLVVAALTIAHIVLVWWLPILPGHDLPQHLATARILAAAADGPLADPYALAARPDPYCTTYALLAALGRIWSVETAARVLYSAYALAMPASFFALARAVQGRATSPWLAVIGALLVWNPVQCMGFLPFMLALPLVLAGAAAAITWARGGGAWWLLVVMAIAALLTSVHLAAALFLLVLVALHALVAWRGRPLLGLAALVAGVGAARLAWRAGVPAAGWPDVVGAVRAKGVLQGVAGAFVMSWGSPGERVNLAVATAFGPFPAAERAVVAMAAAALLVVAWRTRGPRRALAPADADRSFAWAALGFAVLAALAPTSVQRPDDICLIDLRLFFLSLAFALAALPSRLWAGRAARAGLTLFASLFCLIWARQLRGAAREGEAVLRLVGGLDARAAVLALPFHDRSAYFDPANALTHYLPLYHTVKNGGVTSLFWADFAPHLPVAYLPGRAPPRPPDWEPWRFRATDVARATHVLVELPDPDDRAAAREAAARVPTLAEPRLREVGAEGRWRLYAVDQ